MSLPQSVTPPSVSVIMNCYNSARYLKEAIDSVYIQTFNDWEIIFLDNCSMDESGPIAQSYDHKLRYYRSEKTVPLGEARNLALAKARGQYIAFLDCDDTWLAPKLDSQVMALERNPEAGMVFSDSFFFFEDNQGKEFRLYRKRIPPRGKIFKDLLMSYFIPMPTIMVRRTALDAAGGYFDERFNMVEDADLFMRVAYQYLVEYIDAPLARRRMHKDSWTASKKELFPKEEEMLLEKFAILWSNFEKDFAPEIARRRAFISYEYAVLDWEKGKRAQVRARLRPHLKSLRKLWIPFLLSFLPYPVYQRMKLFYKNATAPFWGSVDYQAF